MTRWLIGVVFVLGFAVHVHADPATNNFEDLIREANVRVLQLDAEDTKASRKSAKKLRKVLGKAAKPAKGLRGDIALAKSFAKEVDRAHADDTRLQRRKATMLAWLANDVADLLDHAREWQSRGVATKKARKTIDKLIASGDAAVEASRAATESKVAVGQLKKAERAASKALALLRKVDRDGEPGPQTLPVAPGRMDIAIEVDGRTRDLVVHVPQSYSPGNPTPVVLVLHGPNQSADSTYRNWKWDDECESRGWIGVFLTSTSHRLAAAPTLTVERWNAVGFVDELRDDKIPPDDEKYVETALDIVRANINVDEKRIFATAFSDGSTFLYSRCIPNMSDVFAATATVSGLQTKPYEIVDGAPRPHFALVGTSDFTILAESGGTLPFGDTANLLAHEHIGRWLTAVRSTLQIGDAYTETSDPPWFHTTHFADADPANANTYEFHLVNTLGHNYPTGQHGSGLVVAELFGEFFAAHPRD